MLAVINVEHVLAHGGDLRTIASYRGAAVFYDALFAQYQLIALTAANDEIAHWWLRRERMPKWARIFAADTLGNKMTPEDYRDWQVTQIRSILAAGWEVAFYVDTAAGPHEVIHRMGVNTLVMNRTQTIPGWQNPEQTAPRAWNSLVDTVD
jgi:hypothetical protein